MVVGGLRGDPREGPSKGAGGLGQLCEAGFPASTEPGPRHAHTPYPHAPCPSVIPRTRPGMVSGK